MATRPVNMRFPIDLYDMLQDYAKANNRTISEIVFTACIDYLDKSTPGLCPSCHTQNNPDSQYCQKCGSSLLPGVAEPRVQYNINPLQEQITELTKIITDLERRMALLDAINKKEPDTKNK